ncbi:DNA-directed RNA polymerase III subunit RPC4 isoform X1 [Embiotoca jacksoni]|uniref:DNA-directed RNA polymerase III subunit RPC4 isoform X1 n=1 Tax=Embiotoca jacksoni TaxID=100190 RepID=UPI0037047B8D
MTEPRDAASGPGSSGGGSGAGRSFSPGRGLPGRVRGLSSPPPPGRLTSLRTRDLTLGGTFKKPKKTFEPNVHAVRKTKDELQEEVHVSQRKERREREERRRRESRGRRKERPQTIQSHSIFETGPADNVRKTGVSSVCLSCSVLSPPDQRPHVLSQTSFSFSSSSSHPLYSGWRGSAHLQDSSSAPICKQVKKERKESEDEDEILSKLQRDDFIDDPGLKNDVRLKPIQLPLCQSSSSTHRGTTITCSETHPPPRGPAGGAGSRTEQPSLVELLQELHLSSREELFFMQLPDCMPGRGAGLKGDAGLRPPGDKAAKDGRSEDRRTPHLPGQEAGLKDSCPVLSQLPEGLLGKLQIRRSGKVELKLGDIVMDVSEGAAFSFLQQLVSVRLSDGRTGDMMVLGNVHHKLVLSPDFQALLGQAAAQQPAGP